MVTIEAALRARRDAGGKLLVPYVTGGLGDDWARVVEAVAAAGADAVEIGIPFSDPVMDGPVIQEASQRALASGATPASILAGLARVDVDVPLVVMTYYNIVFRAGHRRFASSLAEQRVAGAIVPDLPLVELDGWAEAADEAGVETILLAAPNTPDATLAQICRRSRGWVYGVAVMGVTGERAALASTAVALGRRLKAVTDKPVLIGVVVLRLPISDARSSRREASVVTSREESTRKRSSACGSWRSSMNSREEVANWGLR